MENEEPMFDLVEEKTLEDLYCEKLDRAMLAYEEMFEAEIQMGTEFLTDISAQDFYDFFVTLQ